MPVGRMRERVSLQEEAETADGGGGYALSWSEVAELWARVEAQSGNESLEAAQLEDAETYRVTIRYRSNVTAKHRLVWNSQPLNIRSVLNRDERKRYLTLICDKGVAV